MEVEGLKRGLNHLLYTEQLGVDLLTTDRSPSVRKVMREHYRIVTHEFDPWHLCKSKCNLRDNNCAILIISLIQIICIVLAFNKDLKKKLGPLANKKVNRDLLPWIKSISNHIWFSSATCGGDPEVISL